MILRSENTENNIYNGFVTVNSSGWYHSIWIIHVLPLVYKRLQHLLLVVRGKFQPIVSFSIYYQLLANISAACVMPQIVPLASCHVIVIVHRERRRRRSHYAVVIDRATKRRPRRLLRDYPSHFSSSSPFPGRKTLLSTFENVSLLVENKNFGLIFR